MLAPDHPNAWHLRVDTNAEKTICGIFVAEKCLTLEEQYEEKGPFSARSYDNINCGVCYGLRCKHCDVWEDRHVDGKCLFMETRYAPRVPRSNEAVP